MLRDNLLYLRNLNGYSQEKLAEKIGISRQAYAKWESGESVPDVEKCARLASLYGVTVDSLLDKSAAGAAGRVPADEEGKRIWGSVILNERGQLVIPKAVRELFGLGGGSRLIMLSNGEGIALLPAERFEAKMKEIMNAAERETGEG